MGKHVRRPLGLAGAPATAPGAPATAPGAPATAPGAPATAPGAPATAPGKRARTGTGLRVPVILSWQLAGGVLTLTAATPRSGSSYQDSWSMGPSLTMMVSTSARPGDTAAPGRTGYLSRASVRQTLLAHDTTYTFGYWIVIRTGERTWYGSSSLTITVGPDGMLATPHNGADTRP